MRNKQSGVAITATVKSHLKSTNNQSYRAKFNWPKFLLLFNRLCMSKNHPRSQTVISSSVLEPSFSPPSSPPSKSHHCQLSQNGKVSLSASGFTVSLWHTRSEGSRQENRDGERNKDSKSKIKWTLCSINNEVQLCFAFTGFSFSCLEYRNMRRKQCFSLTLNFVKFC